MKTLVPLLALFLLAFFAGLPETAHAQNQQALIKRSENRPLRSLAASAAEARARGPRFQDFLYLVPNKPLTGSTRTQEDAGKTDGTAALQTTQGSGTTSVLRAFDAADNLDNQAVVGGQIAPPDPDVDVGPNHIVQMINLVTTIYSKTGGIIEAPFPSNAFWDGQGGLCEAYNQGDPIVVYDERANRWLVSQFAFDDAFTSFAQCVAISQTGDPTGGYHRYEFSFDSYGFNDYPKHGITSESITIMANLFRARGPFFNFAGTFLGAMDKNAMYAGQTATLVGAAIGTAEFGFVAADLDGSAGTTVPALFATAMSNSGQFDIWEVDVNWNNPGAATVGRIAQVSIPTFDADLCSASREACVPQPGTSVRLEAISDRLMQRLQIRDFGAYRTMLAAHTVDAGSGRAGIRWYELRESGGTWSLYQEGTFAPNDGRHRWMPSIAMNGAGDIGIGYLIANGSNLSVSTAVAGQSASASGSGLFDAAEDVCRTGSGAQTGSARAGDYSATVVDPTTGTFWHTNEFMNGSGWGPWATTVCEFSVEGDGAPPANQPPTASFTFDCTGLSCSFNGSGSSDTDGSVTGYAWTFGDNTGATGQTTSHTYAASGNYSVTLTVTDDDNATGSQTQTVSVQSGSTSELFVDAITTTTVNAGKGNKRGQATVTIVDGQGAGEGSVQVAGRFTGTFTENAAGTTTNNGTVTFTTDATAKGGVTVGFCVESVTKNGFTWAQSPPVCSAAAKADETLATLGPDGYVLEGNYPNPFNPSTVVVFSLPEAAHVTLRVYNVLGQEVATLVDGFRDAGRHEAAFDAGRLSAGVYLYTVEAGPFTATRRMTLLK